MSILKYLQLPFFFDADLLQQEVVLLATKYWKLHYQTLQYEGAWSAIPLRSSNGDADNILISPLKNSEYKNTALLEQCPYIQKILVGFNCPLQAVRLLKLDAGAIIKEHCDQELCFEKGEIRIHIPVTTNDKVEFFSDKERLFLKEGECWYVNFNLPHNINNFSTQSRIHLVIDANVNEWVQNLFAEDTGLPAKYIEKNSMLNDAAKLQMIDSFRKMNTPTGNKLADEREQQLLKSSD